MKFYQTIFLISLLCAQSLAASEQVLTDHHMTGLSFAITAYSKANNGRLPDSIEQLELDTFVEGLPVDSVYYVEDSVPFEGGSLVVMATESSPEPRDGI